MENIDSAGKTSMAEIFEKAKLNPVKPDWNLESDCWVIERDPRKWDGDMPKDKD